MTYSCSQHLTRHIRDSQEGLHKRVVVSPAECSMCDYCKKNAKWVVNPE